MLRNKLVRSDGSIIDSSAIISCDFTEEVNSGENLSVGDTTSSEINLEILSTDMVEQGEILNYYIVEDGVEKHIGVFNAEKPTVASRTTIKFSAYDNLVKSEKVFSEWLRDNKSLFPMTLATLVTNACEYCGLTLATTEFPQCEIEINDFYADGITCRQILSWASAIAGRFVRANNNGEIEFAWYTNTSNYTVAPSKDGTAVSVSDDGAGNVNIVGEVTVSDDGEGNVSLEMSGVKTLYNNGVVSLVAEMAIPYKQGGLSYEAYTTDLIERVQIKQSDDDIGVIYPQEVTGNCFTIRENLLLATCDTDVITQVAMSLYEQLCTISYIPAKVSLARTIAFRAGDIINIRDPNGTKITTYVMKVSVSPSGTSVESTGNKSYEANAAVSSEKYQNLTGKMLEIRKTIDGLVIKNTDLEGKVGGLELSTSEFKTYVGNTFVTEDEFGEYKQTVSTEFTQTKESFEMKFGTAIADLNTDVQEKYNERVSYIRFEDGNIILGRTGSDITLVQTNNRISFMRGKQEVAYIANDNMYITQGEFLTQLRIGKFGFNPGVNGNLSFKKVVS